MKFNGLEFNEIIAIYTLLGSVLGVVFNELYRGSLKYFFNSKIQKQKSVLDQKVEESVTKLRGDIEREMVLLQVSYGNVYQKQSEAVFEIYQLLLDLSASAERIVEHDDSLGGTVADIHDAKGNFDRIYALIQKSYIKNRLVLPLDLDEDIDSLQRKYRVSVTRFYRSSKRASRLEFGSDEREKIIGKLMDIEDSIFEDLPSEREKIFMKMRDLIGVRSR